MTEYHPHGGEWVATAGEWEQFILASRPQWQERWEKKMAVELRRLPKPISERDRFRTVHYLFEELSNADGQAILQRGFKRASAAKRRGLCKVEEGFEAAQIHLGKTANTSGVSSPRLRTHSQKSTVAARAMAERKTFGHRS